MASALNGAASVSFEQLVGLLARRRHASGRRSSRRWWRCGRTRWRCGTPCGCVGVVAVVPVRIVAHRVGDHPPHHPVAARHRGRLRRHRHQRVHQVRIGLAPHPGLHAAHRIADHQAQMLDAEPLGDQPVLRRDHVGVVVEREFGAQPVGRLGRFPGADRVRQDDEIFRGVERLARRRTARRRRPRQETGAGASGAVQDQHRLAGRRADRRIVQPHFGHHLAGVEAEVLGDPVALLRRRIVGRHTPAARSATAPRPARRATARSGHGLPPAPSRAAC